MAADGQSWSSNANDAVRISLIQPGASDIRTVSTFHPKFTYPIFGEEEHIFGYKDLDLHLRYAAHDLRPHLDISYKEKFKPVGGTTALDLHKTLKEWLPENVYQPKSEFEKVVKSGTAKTFTPPGKLVHSYSRKGRTFEIWGGSLTDPAVKNILDRIQIFISFFIEGGTPLNTEDVEWTVDRWTIYFVYEKMKLPRDSEASPYGFVGYATTYRFYSFAVDAKKGTKATISNASFPQEIKITPSELPSRLRISQFLILPPHQRYGHGSELYNAIFDISLNDPTVIELTVEDPNEEFDLIRDVNDYTRIEPELAAASISINPNPIPAGQKRGPKRLPTKDLLPMTKLNGIRRRYKIAPRQFSRITEMYLLSKIPRSSRAMGGANMVKIMTQKWRLSNTDERTYYWWRMLLKQRVYKKNRDTLVQLDAEDRLGKLEETVRMQEAEYELILQAIEDRRAKLEGKLDDDEEAVGKTGAEMGAANSSAAGSARKRKLIVDPDDDEDEEDGDDDAGIGETNGNGDGAKRLRT